jgi:3-oxoacyl-[acyl-carrier-protein] synthase II
VTHERVVITGLGLVTTLGHSIEEFWQACQDGRTNVERVPQEWGKYYLSKSFAWSPLQLPDYTIYGLTRSDILRYDPVVLNAIVASDNALADAKFALQSANERTRSYKIAGVNTDRLGVFIGTGLGCITSAFTNYVPHLLRNASDEIFIGAVDSSAQSSTRELQSNLQNFPRVSPFASVQSMSNAIAAQLSIRYGARAAAETLIYACASGTAAIARAFRAIQNNEMDIAIAGGSEYYGDRAGGVFMAFDRLQTLVKPTESLDQGNRPFDVDRSGFLFSQGGAGMVVL